MIKAIFHVDEMPKWNLTLKNVQNLLQLVDTSTSKVEVLANAEAVRFYAMDDEKELKSQMKNLVQSGVYFAACNNALTAFGIAKEALDPFVTVVPAGVLELIEKQSQGYAYIKP